MVRIFIISFLLMFLSTVRSEGSLDSSDGASSSRNYHSQFQFYGIDFFYSSVSPDEVFDVFGKANVIYKTDDFNSPFMFCYRSQKDSSGLVFRGIANRIESLMMIKDFDLNGNLSIRADSCQVSNLVTLEMKTAEGLSLMIDKNKLLDMFREDISYDNKYNLYKITSNGVLFEPEAKILVRNDKHYRMGFLYDVGIYIKYVGDRVKYITLSNIAEASIIQVEP